MRTLTRLTAGTLLALSLAACGGGDDDAGVASLGGDATTTTARGGGGSGDPADFQDAMLEYAECMREQGIDMPDPRSDGDGVVIIGPAADGDPGDLEEFEAAEAECRHILDDVEGSIPEPTPEELQEMQDRALAFAECMREHGIDFPDPQFDGNGGVRIGFNPEGGVDPRDPDFQEAQEACAEETGGGILGRAGTIGEGDDEDAEGGQ